MALQVLVEMSEAQADDERLDELTQSLRQEILQLDVDSVSGVSEGAAPPGSKGLELAALGTLIVVMKGSVELAEQVVTTIRAWLHRSPSTEEGRSLKITVNGQTLELSSATEGQQQQLVEQFLRSAVTQGQS